MEIIWYGYSCFLIKTSIGKRILIDPFNKYLKNNFDLPKCDLITISHSNFDNSLLNNYDNKIQIINESGFFDMDFIKVEGLNSFHDTLNGLKRGPNIIYIFRDENYSICHLGHLGHIVPKSTLEKLKDIDVLLIPIGGNFTLDGFEAAKLCKLISPKCVIPMHYKTNEASLYLDTPKNFIISMKHIQKINSNSIDTSILNLNSETQCILLTCPNNQI